MCVFANKHVVRDDIYFFCMHPLKTIALVAPSNHHLMMVSHVLVSCLSA